MTLKIQNESRWNACQINTNRLEAFKSIATRLSSPDAKARYTAVSKRTGVPWWFIAVVHEREASQSWRANIAQGDPWNKRSVHVPKGRGPFNSWEDAAVDALTNCAPYAAKNTDWSVGGALAMLEKYNGLGYYNKGLPSPYIWAGTNQYVRGKYVADGRYSPTAVDTQLGCAGILKQMGVFNSTGHITTGAGVVVSGIGIAAYFHQYWPWIVAGSLAVAFLVSLIVYLYKRK